MCIHTYKYNLALLNLIQLYAQRDVKRIMRKNVDAESVQINAHFNNNNNNYRERELVCL